MTSVEKVKVITLGDSGVGKSSLAKKFVEGHFSNTYDATIGMDYLYKDVMVDDKIVKMEIWDTGGQDKFNVIVTSYFRGAHCCVLVFDVTDRSSFESLDFNIRNFLNIRCPEVPEDFPFVVLGNKCEMEARSVTTPEARKWYQSKHSNITYFEVSAKEGQNVEGAFLNIATKALEQKKFEDKMMNLTQRIKLNIEESDQVKPSRRCC